MSIARWVNVGMGAWLFVSAWLLPAPPALRLGQCLAALTIFLVAFVAMAYERVRWGNTALALALVLSPFALALPVTPASVNLLAGGLVALAASLWPGHRRRQYA